MGANLRTHWLPNGRIEQVMPALSAWLSAKGFEPIESPSHVWPLLVGHGHLGVRGLVLAENERGVAVCYSEVWSEGDRLIFELRRLGPVLLEIWLHDSDIWGYRLFRDGETIASFCSNPRFFGREDYDEETLRLGRNGDAKLLTHTLGVPEQEQALRELQTKKRVFAESLTDDFAELIGASALALDYLDWQELGVHAFQNETHEVADHRVRAILYVARTEPAQRAWNLHRIPARQAAQSVPGEFVGDPAVITDDMMWTIAVLRALAIPIGLLIRAVALPIGLVLRYRPQWILGRLRAPLGTAEEPALRRALRELALNEGGSESQGFVQQGERFVHRGCGVALTPAPGVTIDPSPPRSDLCLLRVFEQVGMLSVRDFDSTEALLGNLPGEVLEDLHETTPDRLPLRFVTCETTREMAVALGHRAGRSRNGKSASDEPVAPPRIFFAFVQEERFVYLLNMGLHERQDDSAEALKATMRSFQRAPVV